MNEPLKIEFLISAPPSKVWKAITDKDEMKEWFINSENFEPVEGNLFQFTGEKDGVKYLHHCRVTEVIENQKLSYTWRYENYEGDSTVTFDLKEENGLTKLLLTHEGLETFPKSNPHLARHQFEEGWTYLLGTLLKKFV